MICDLGTIAYSAPCSRGPRLSDHPPCQLSAHSCLGQPLKVSHIAEDSLGSLTPASELCKSVTNSTTCDACSGALVLDSELQRHLAADADVSKGGAACDPDLGLHQIHAGDLLRARVFHLHQSTTCFIPSACSHAPSHNTCVGLLTADRAYVPHLAVVEDSKPMRCSAGHISKEHHDA